MGGSSSKPAEGPPATPPAATLYKATPRWKVDDYNIALETYNRPFTNVANIVGKEAVLVSQNYTTNYNPPMPPWIADNSADNDFIYQIGAYRSQLENARATVRLITENLARNGYMIRFLNNPPTPRPPASIYITNEPRPAMAGSASKPVDGNLSALERAYKDVFDEGRVLLESVGITNYKESVPYNPPKPDDTRRRVDEKFFELRDIVRQLYAQKTGFEPINFSFPYSILTREGFAGTTQTSDTVTYNGKIYKCAALDDYALWSIRNINEKREFCEAKGYTYIPGLSSANCPCYEEVITASASVAPAVVAPPTAQGPAGTIPVDTGDRNTSLADEPATALLYKYNISPVKFSSYNIPKFDGYDGNTYSTFMSGKSTININDIDAYYNYLKSYNHYWQRLNGWKVETVPSYNPPRPFWYSANSAEDKAYRQLLVVFNDKIQQKKTQFERGLAVNLPADFGELPALPAYPNTLRELLENPARFADPGQAGNLPSAGLETTIKPGGASASVANQAITFELPMNKVGEILTYIKEKPPAAPGSASMPKCGGQSMCTKYKESPPMVKKFLEDRERQIREQQKINEKISSYAMNTSRSLSGGGAGAGAGAAAAGANLAFLKELKPTILNEIKSFMQSDEGLCTSN